MKRVQENAFVKGIVVLFLILSAFFGGMLGFEVLSLLPYAEAQHWQETSRFQVLLQERENQIARGVAYTLELEQAEQLTYPERQQLEAMLNEVTEGMKRENTWFRYRLLDADGTTVYHTNLTETERLETLVENVYYVTFLAGDHVVYRNMDELSHTPAPSDTPVIQEEPATLVIECGVAAQVDYEQIPDEFSHLKSEFDRCEERFDGFLQYTVLLLAVAVVCLVWLLWSAGHKEGVAGISFTWQEKTWLELYLLVAGTAGVLAFIGLLYLGEYFYLSSTYAGIQSDELFLVANIGASVLTVVLVGAAALILRTLAVRLKAGKLIRSTLIGRLVCILWDGLRSVIEAMPYLWRTIAGFVLYFFLDLLLYQRARYNGLAAVGWFALNLLALGLICWWAIGFRRLRRGAQNISAGNLSVQIDTRRMPDDLRKHAEELNNLSSGLSEAVEERMKSERFKAELITNVSHDLKTPLTSIINYVNLLKTTRQDDPKAVEYIEVLDRKSMRLKKLTEDLVEASKASTGVLTVQREKIGMAQLMDQALGEWAEKLQERNLTLVTTMPEGETWVYADGRHLWRVVDNLLSNCAKYAMEGTRIYLDLVQGKGQVVLSVKNISREPLNVPPERLMERFVRGEESRSTEGSGLGLSIARSLTELQGGSFELAVDGDLFKATVTLTQAN